MPKRLVLSFDGTWNTPDKHPEMDGDTSTNVFRFHESVEDTDADGIRQLKWYDEGVGTRWYNRVRGGTFGVGLSQNIRQGYRFLVENYEDGDEIYLLGFSRGAYTARSLVGMIRNAGLLHPERIRDLPAAYQLYRSRDEGADSQSAVFFRESRSRPVRIHFLGVWDTVGALGIPLESFDWFNKKHYEFHDVELSAIVDNAFHALAIDEHRKNFAPSLWSPKRITSQRIEQVWFPGAHANVGGGYPEKELSDIALHWMQARADECGLNLKPSGMPKLSDHLFTGPIRDSYGEFAGGAYKLFQRRFLRDLGTTDHGNEQLHPAVIRRLSLLNEYRPRNEVCSPIPGTQEPFNGRL